MRKLPRKSSRGEDGQAFGCATSVGASCAGYDLQNVPRAGADGAPRGPTALRWAGDGWAAGVSALASAAFSVTSATCLLLSWKV